MAGNTSITASTNWHSRISIAIRRLPYSLKILLENILRFEQGGADAAGDINAFAEWLDTRSSQREIAFRPARVLMQDLTGVPAVVDLAAMRDAAVGPAWPR